MLTARPKGGTRSCKAHRSARQGRSPAAIRGENGLTDPARTDVSDDDAFGELAALSPEEKLAALEEAVARHPLNREVLYKILAYCAEERALEDMERKIASWPEFRGATQNQRRMAETLVRAHGLERKEYDADDAAITPKRMEGLGEDEASDLAASIAYRTTEAGARFVERHRPRARLEELLQLSPIARPLTWSCSRSRPRSRAPTAKWSGFCAGGPSLRRPSTAPGSPCSQACLWTNWSAAAPLFGMTVGPRQRREGRF